MEIDKRSLMEFAANLAVQSGEIIRQSENKIQSIEHKSEVDLVTDIDRKVQDFICGSIHKEYPAHNITSEEQFERREESPFRWIIDPIDGTTNFVHGYPMYGVSIALEYRDDIVLGAVCNPCRDELFSAVKGGGAFLNAQRICVSKTEALEQSLIATGFSYAMRETRKSLSPYLGIFKNMVEKAQGIRRDGSAALDLCSVACGRFDGFFEEGLKEWDVAAGQLIVHEAGGRVTDFSGELLYRGQTTLLASNSRIHKELQEITLHFLELYEKI
ncbi:MAG: inositol monophosphatase [Candidatus Aureabacteria bacterium]|nr:inositol monophosphatase [Candidatus Auribacterota bacterium]